MNDTRLLEGMPRVDLPDQPATTSFWGSAVKVLRDQFPARSVPNVWPMTLLSRDEIMARVRELPAEAGLSDPNETMRLRRRGTDRVLQWLESFPGEMWQQRWHNSSLPYLSKVEWRNEIRPWLDERGWASDDPVIDVGVNVLLSIDVVRPDLDWLLNRRWQTLRTTVPVYRDPEGFAELKAVADPQLWTTPTGVRARLQIIMLMVAKGGGVGDITVGDCLQLRDAEAQMERTPTRNCVFYAWLKQIGAFPQDAPPSLRGVRVHAGQVSMEELVDRYHLRCRPIRDLLVEYLTERQPALDYTSLNNLSRILARNFWADLERHHPGIQSLHLAPQVAFAWRQRLQTKTVRSRQPDGSVVEVTSQRSNAYAIVMAVRSFYLDLAQWAIADPARWARWAAPCPFSATDVGYRKHDARVKARMDQRTRERLPALPTLLHTAHQRMKDARVRLEALQDAEPGACFTVFGKTFTRAIAKNHHNRQEGSSIAYDPNGRRVNLKAADHRAFWAWASIEILRHTGVRIEEMLEVSHHSIVQYTLPSTGEIVPLLQIAPSKTDEERLLLVSPELADVLSAILSHIRDRCGTIPLISSYDIYERVWNPPMPLLFQRHLAGQSRPLSSTSIREAITEVLQATGLTDSQGQPLHYQPHDFRRIFVTEAIMGGLPPHIAQVICGHKNIDTTMGYKAIYPSEAIEAHRAFIARRRALRPGEEYRIPTDEEWDAFLGHFEKRKLSVGTCGRAFGTACIHEHACVRCSMLRPDPTQRSRLVEIRDNLIARIAEAEREGWLGEVEGLKVSLAGAQDKLAQLDRRTAGGTAISLGMPRIAAAQPSREQRSEVLEESGDGRDPIRLPAPRGPGRA